MADPVESISKHLSLGRALAAVGRSAAAVLLGIMAFGAALALSKAKLDGAIQRPEFADSAKAIRQALAAHVNEEAARHASTDSVIRASQRRLEEMVVRQEDRDCAEKGYPLPWCAEAARRIRTIGPAAQAGRGRP